MNKVRSSQSSISKNSCTELSKTQLASHRHTEKVRPETRDLGLLPGTRYPISATREPVPQFDRTWHPGPLNWDPGSGTPTFSSWIRDPGLLKWEVNKKFTSLKVWMLQWIYRYITGKLKLETIKNSLSLNVPAKVSRLLTYCILNLLTLKSTLMQSWKPANIFVFI